MYSGQSSSPTSSDTQDKLLIVGNPETIHIGACMQRAAQALKIPSRVCDTRIAFDAGWLSQQFNWRLRGRRPPQLNKFSQHVLDVCKDYRPRWMLTIGLAPVTKQVIQRVREMNVTTLNYLTDDPWNRACRSRWFFEALPYYDWVFSPRRANLEDLERLGCPHVAYLPFGYDPTLHFPDPPMTEQERQQYQCDVLFYGGADRDRLPYIQALIEAGVDVHLYGGYWERHPAMRAHDRGIAGPEVLRKAVGGAKTTLCLVRRANRDGHVMRTYEVPAIGGCMLAEDTPEHREIFGQDGERVVYFDTVDEMLVMLRSLLAHDQERQRLAARTHAHITSEANTYRDRLQTMLNTLVKQIAQ